MSVAGVRHPVWRSPQALLIGGFAALILIGAALLSLPFCHEPGGHGVGWFDACFTATSAVCVTGLVVADTAETYSFWGELVILCLIQIGGLGIMTFAAAAMQMLRGRLSLRSAAALQDTLLQRDSARDLRKLFRRVLTFTFAIEMVGALVLFVPWWVYGGAESGVAAAWRSLFHAVSAFCNAGFALQGDVGAGAEASLEFSRTNGWVLTPICLLIVLGGLGYTVLIEGWQWLTRREGEAPVRFSYHSRVVLWMTGGLLVGGWLALVFFGTVPGATLGERAVDAAFLSVTARTAGFNTVPTAALPAAALFVMVLLMFVGGSPGSTAGGVKTTTVVIAVSEMQAGLRGEGDVLVGQRRLPTVLVRRALLLLGVAVMWVVIGVLVLLVTEPELADERFMHLVFEQVSALGTAGLSADVTADLSPIGRGWIMLSMFMGRLGPLTIGVWVAARERGHVRFPEGRLMIG